MWKKSYSFQQSPHINVFKKIISEVLNNREIWANLTGWWLLGICVDFCYWTVITAAHDLLSLNEDNTDKNISSTRHCNKQSEGFILVLDVLPSFTISLLLPFLPLWINIRFVVLVLILVSSILLIATNLSWGSTLTGIGLCSLYSGMGLSTCLQYMNIYKRTSKVSAQSLIFAWSSGIGASGFFASFYYVVLTENGVSVQTVAFTLLIMPAMLAFAFWVLLSNPREALKPTAIEETNKEPQLTKLEMKEKFRILWQIAHKYLVPNSLVFFLQYTINQGFFELMNFNQDFITVALAARLLQFDYLFSNFLFKSIGCLIKVDYLWVLATFQCINLILIATQAIYGWMGRGVLAFVIVLIIIFWEGCVASVTYVNTFRRVNNERPEGDRGFSLSITAFGEPCGVLSAGFASVLVHKAICQMAPTPHSIIPEFHASP